MGAPPSCQDVSCSALTISNVVAQNFKIYTHDECIPPASVLVPADDCMSYEVVGDEESPERVLSDVATLTFEDSPLPVKSELLPGAPVLLDSVRTITDAKPTTFAGISRQLFVDVPIPIIAVSSLASPSELGSIAVPTPLELGSCPIAIPPLEFGSSPPVIPVIPSRHLAAWSRPLPSVPEFEELGGSTAAKSCEEQMLIQLAISQIQSKVEWAISPGPNPEPSMQPLEEAFAKLRGIATLDSLRDVCKSLDIDIRMLAT